MYSLNVGTFQVSGIFNNLAGGNYAITVQDANLCTAAVTATIIEPEAISIDSTKVNASRLLVVLSRTMLSGQMVYLLRTDKTLPVELTVSLLLTKMDVLHHWISLLASVVLKNVS
jgi:hypothetical protein